MKYYSEITKNYYNTEKECVEAEQKIQQQRKEQEAKAKKLVEEKKGRANEVQEAYKALREAQKKYNELKNAFIKDYGYFHMSYYEPDTLGTVFSLMEDICKF